MTDNEQPCLHAFRNAYEFFSDKGQPVGAILPPSYVPPGFVRLDELYSADENVRNSARGMCYRAHFCCD